MASETKHIDLVMRLVDQVSRPLVAIRSNMEKTANISQRIGRTVRNVGRSISGIGESLMPASMAIVGAATLGANAFINFDAIITGAGAKAGATADEMQKMRDAAAKLGADMPISATDAATAMDRLAAAGYSANEVIGAMPAIVTASVASGEDLATTSDVVSNALNIWALRSGDVAANAAHVADVVQVAANQSSLGMQDFGVAMQYAGAPAATLGVSIEDLSTAMAIMKNNGIEASTIGTSLRSTFTRLSAPPKQAALAIEQLGLQTKDAAGNFLGLQPIIEQLRDKMSGMSNTEQVAIAKALAGEEAYSGLLSLIRTAPDDYQKMADAIHNADGASNAQYEVMSKTMKVTIDNMLGSFESLAISMGTVLTPQINSIANALGSFADMLNGLSPETKLLVGNILGGVLAFTAFTLVLGRIVSFGGSTIVLYSQMAKALKSTSESTKTVVVVTRALNSGFGLLRRGLISAGSAMVRMSMMIARAGMAFVASPIGLILVAIAAAVYLLYTRWDQFAPYFISAWNRIKSAFSGAVTMIMPSLQRLGQAFQPIISLLQRLWEIFIMIGQFIGGVFVGIIQMVSNIISVNLSAAIIATAGILTSTFTMALNAVANIANMLIGVLTGVIIFLTGVFTGNWESAWNGIVQIFDSIFSGVLNIGQGIIDGLRGMINSVIDGINSISVSVPEWVPGVGGQVYNPAIPHLYSGTENWKGGPAMVHDRGAEIIDLPSGSRVIPHDQSINTAYSQGQRSAGGTNITINIANANMGSGGDMRKLARDLADQLLYELQTRAVNQNEGAI